VDVPERYVPAAGRRRLTASYDRTVALTMREDRWRPAVVAAATAGAAPGATVAEVGCGTGSLTLAVANARPDLRVVGLDGDPEVLGMARAKAGADRVEWLRALADDLPLGEGEATAVICSLLLHHVPDDGKPAVLAELARVVAPGGALVVADWAPPGGPGAALGLRALQLFDGRAGFGLLLAGGLPELVRDAGFTGDVRLGRLRTCWGLLEVRRFLRS
jgi:ubiquinone/menaquinone biosynthesis C-methylase UbiE